MEAVAATDDPVAMLEAVQRLNATDEELASNADYSSLYGDEAVADVTLILKMKNMLTKTGVRRPPRRSDASSSCDGNSSSSRSSSGGGEGGGGNSSSSSSNAENTSSAAGDGEPSAATVKTLKVHGTVLMQRSAYFEPALKGAFQEGRDKTITLMFDDEEALEDMQMLISAHLHSGPPSFRGPQDNDSWFAGPCKWL